MRDIVTEIVFLNPFKKIGIRTSLGKPREKNLGNFLTTSVRAVPGEFLIKMSILLVKILNTVNKDR